jgi:hypothetical protein
MFSRAITHFIIADTRKFVPGNFAIRRHNLHIRKISPFGGRLHAGVNILDTGVAHTHERHTQRQPFCNDLVHLSAAGWFA